MRALRIIAILAAAGGLIVNAIVHLALAGVYDAIPGALLSQGALFRIQAVIGIVLAVLLLVSLWMRRFAALIALAAAVVAGGGLALVVITAIVPLDLTALGLPYLFEPIWFPDKVITVVAQAVALVSAALAALLARRATRAAQR